MHYLSEHKDVDVVLMQSLNTPTHLLPHLPGFFYPPKIGVEDNRVMVAIYVSCRLQYSSLSFHFPPMEVRFSYCAVSITDGEDRQVNIVNVYYPEGSTSTSHVDWLNTLSSNSRWIVVGDFNVRHCSWDSSANSGQGEHLSDVILSCPLSLLNDGAVTRLATHQGQVDTAIDLSLASPSLAIDSSWHPGSDHLQSDHLPIHINISGLSPTQADFSNVPKYNYDKADWQLFANTQDSLLATNPPTHDDVDTYLSNINSIFLSSADQAIPKYSCKPQSPAHSTAWWNEDCENAIQQKRHCLRRFKMNATIDNRQALRAASTHCDDVILQAKRNHWEHFVRKEVTGPSDSSKLWKKIRKFRQHRRCPPAPLLINGSLSFASLAQANALASSFAKASQTAHLPEDVARLRREKEKTFSFPSADDSSSSFNSDLSVSELDRALGAIRKADKSTGEDAISYAMLQHCSVSMRAQLLHFFQVCWSSGTLPFLWKKAIVVPVHKQGKPKTELSSYRPIALTSHLCKVYERLVLYRLEFFLEKFNIIPKCQAGFRRGRSCIEHVVRLVEHVKKSMSHNRSTAAIFFDIKGAFDSVWHQGLLFKLSRLGISGRLFQFIKSFLHERQIVVRVGSSISATHILDMGVPQGSVVSPILFSLMLHDIESVCRPGFHLSLYADDIALWAPYNSRGLRGFSLWAKTFQWQVTATVCYLECNGFVLSPQKTELVFFSRSSCHRPHFSVQINNQIIKCSSHARFLGVYLSQKLTWKRHIEHITTKARRAVNLIKILSHQSWVSQPALVLLVQSLVRSILSYGAECFIGMPKTHWRTVTTVEMAALKCVLHLPQRAVNDLVYQEVGWLPLRDHCIGQAANFEARMQAVSSPTAEISSVRFRNVATLSALSVKLPRVHATCAPLSSHTQMVWEKCTIKHEDVTPTQSLPTPSWLLLRPVFDIHYGQGRTKTNDLLLLKSLAQEKIANTNHTLQIYTDASRTDDDKVGCAFTIPSLKITKLYSLPSTASVFTAEIYAIIMACSFVCDLPQPPFSISLFSDSKSALQAIHSHGRSRSSPFVNECVFLFHQIIAQGSQLSVFWLPSHTGFRGNEAADVAAKVATISGTPVSIPITSSSVKAQVKKALSTIRSENMKTKCDDHGWLCLPVGQSQLGRLSPRNQRILSRIRTVSARYLFFSTPCVCGNSNITLPHILSGCSYLPTVLIPLWNYKTRHKLSLSDFLCPHPKLGLEPQRLLSNCILASDLLKSLF